MTRRDLDNPQNCLCFNFRKAARAVARRYDATLAPAGISSAQFSTLATLRAAGPLNMTQLSGMLETERTTLTRNLNLLETQGFIIRKAGEDIREKRVAITAKGRRKLDAAAPLWAAAQSALVSAMGESAAMTALKSANTLEAALRPSD